MKSAWNASVSAVSTVMGHVRVTRRRFSLDRQAAALLQELHFELLAPGIHQGSQEMVVPELLSGEQGCQVRGSGSGWGCSGF